MSFKGPFQPNLFYVSIYVTEHSFYHNYCEDTETGRLAVKRENQQSLHVVLFASL